MIFRKSDRQKAIGKRIFGVAATSVHHRSCGRPVMAIGHVGGFHVIKNCDHLLNVSGIRNGPNGVTYLVFSFEIVQGRLGRMFFKPGIKSFSGGTNQEHGPALGAQCFDVISAIFFFIGAGVFVLANNICSVICHGGQRHQTGLGLSLPNQAIHINRIGTFLHQGALRSQTVERCLRLGVSHR